MSSDQKGSLNETIKKILNQEKLKTDWAKISKKELAEREERDANNNLNPHPKDVDDSKKGSQRSR